MSESYTNRTFHLRYFLQILAVAGISSYLLIFQFNGFAVGLAFAAAALTAYSMGLFHHMQLSHESFKAHPAVIRLGSLLGTLTWRGPMAAPIRYAALHKVHHAHSDQKSDPHSPVNGIFHSFLGWMWNFDPFFARFDSYKTLAPRLAGDRFIVYFDGHVDRLQAYYGLSVLAVATITAALLSHPKPWTVGLTFSLYLVFLKTAFVLVLANAVDVVNHKVGYRNFKTSDQSSNSAFMGVIHLGGAISWHNNHHAKPAYFSVKARPWEIDMHLLMVRALAFFGLTWDIKTWDGTRTLEPSTSNNQLRRGKQMTLRDLHGKDPWKVAVMIVQRLGLWAVTLAALSALYQSAPWVWTITLSIPLLAIAAISLQNLALVGHEGTHFNLAIRRLNSVRLGNTVSALVPFHANMGFGISHSLHHKFTNTNRDPDKTLFGRESSLWGRLVRSRRKATMNYLNKTWDVAQGRISLSDKEALGFNTQTLQRLAKENLLVVGISLGGYAALIPVFGFPLLAALLSSYLAAAIFSGLRPYLEHVGTGSKDGFNARTFTSRAMNLVFGQINFHHAHHRYPGVPAYRMAALQNYLVQNDEEGSISTTSWRTLGELLTTGTYGTIDTQGSKEECNNQTFVKFAQNG